MFPSPALQSNEISVLTTLIVTYLICTCY